MPGPFADVFNKGGIDKTVVHKVRAWLRQPFQAPDWLDLRVGFFLSLTKAANLDDPTGLGPETITDPGGTVPPETRYWIGLKDRSDSFPHNTGTVFIGFTNAQSRRGPRTGFDSQLVASDGGIGGSGSFWRPKNAGADTLFFGGIFDGIDSKAEWRDGVQQHFSSVSGGNYATLLMFRLQRDNVNAQEKMITVSTKSVQSAHSGDVLFSSTPTEAVLRTNLASFPTAVQTLGPIEMSVVPDCLYLYWPFSLSRLRVHAAGILKTR